MTQTPDTEKIAAERARAPPARRRDDGGATRCPTRAARPARTERARGLAPARRAAAAAARAGRLDGADRRPLRGHRGDLLDRRRRPLLGGPLQPQLDPRGEAPRPLRQRPPADPPLDPRRGALAGLGDGAGDAGARRPAGDQPGRAALAEERDRARRRHPGRQLRPPRRPALGLAPGDADGARHRGRRARHRRHRRPPRRHPPGDAPAPGRLPLDLDRGGLGRAGPPRQPRRHRRGRRGRRHRARRRHRTADVGARRRAADRGVQGGRPGAHLPAPALRPARPGDRAEPPRRAAGPRLPLLRPAALDPGDEAGDGHRRLRPPAGRCSRRSCCSPRWRS